MKCYCDSQKNFNECCEPVLNGISKPPTPERLMRSRYSAYVLGDAKYILDTTVKEKRFYDELEPIKEFSKSVTWLGLFVVYAKDNIVEFKAYYKDNEGIKLQHERSSFIFEDGVWFYDNGLFLNTKIQRNDSCPCKSGKKYKKCCG
ncbi:MAG: YchJ family metal-binding protein [Sulfurimonas sp.]|uniref:YchJ family protein n=1 Tax=Sulfurimonas sp. TaxID=2022749 RepID=UPI002628E758|nr:YchJ family metal-binding protein [Sulfurimonas sp.]MDD5372138.1 YchJ family metal-binding protein [Sulfurimonas sp.]